MKTRDIAEMAVMCALMFVGKEAFRMIPNVHLVAPMILLCVILYGWKALLPTYGFVALEIMLNGFGIWTAMYLYIWPLLVVIGMPLRNSRKWILWAVVAAVHGLCFGALCEIPFIFTSGFKAAAGYWLSGLPYDAIHGVSNFAVTLLMLPVLYKVSMKYR